MHHNHRVNRQKLYPTQPRGIILALWMVFHWGSSFGLAFLWQPQEFVASRPRPSTPRFALHAWGNYSEDFIASVLYEGTFQEVDDGILSYLCDGGRTMPPKTKRFLRRITRDYVYGIGAWPNLDGSCLLELMESEYETLPVTLILGNTTIAPGQGDPIIVQIVSLGVLYGLPAEILLKVLDFAAAENEALTDFRKVFEVVGWEQVRFPSGLGLRIKKGIVSRSSLPPSRMFFPPSRLPWRSRSSRKAAQAAEMGVKLAAEAKAPKQNIMTREEFLVEIENEIYRPPLSEVAVADMGDVFSSGALVDLLPSFPSQGYGLAWTRIKRWLMNSSNPFANNKVWKKFSMVWDKQYNQLKDTGRAGLMAYAFLNFVLYTVGMTWQWRRLAGEAPSTAGTTIVSMTIRKLVKAFTRVYLGAAVFKLGRIAASLAMAPAAARILRFTQRKLRVSENAAFIILITLLVKTFCGTIALVCLGDSAFRQAIRFPLHIVADKST